MGPYHIVSSTAETMRIDESGMPNTVPSDRASLALQPDIDTSATSANDSHQYEYPEGLLGE